VAARDRTSDNGSGPRWAVVGGQELRDLWLGGRALLLLLAFSVLLSVITYLGATSEGINFLEKRETVNLTLQVAVMFGALVALLVAADAISGERERGTLESLLLTPVPRRHLLSGKLLGALSLWFAALAVAVPYVWFLGRDVGAVDDALLAGLLVGTLVAISLAAFGIIVRTLSALSPNVRAPICTDRRGIQSARPGFSSWWSILRPARFAGAIHPMSGSGAHCRSVAIHDARACCVLSPRRRALLTGRACLSREGRPLRLRELDHARKPRVGAARGVLLDSYATSQAMSQFPQCIRVAPSLRESPVASIETPPVRSAPVAFPPLMPFFLTTAVGTT
jgi:ABC-type transport system involved in cytochrome c biogenesis permease component